MELDAKVCYCFHVSKRKILSFIRHEKPRVPSLISECGGAGTGCGRQLEAANILGLPREYVGKRVANSLISNEN